MWQTNEACLKCHPTQVAQLSMPYHHPLREGKMTCVDCHDPHGGPDDRNLKVAVANVNPLCLTCHAQYRGPYAYQHPPVTENCMNCHVAHGSPNTNLLTLSEPALCLQCHAGHHDGAGLPLADRCTNCHGSIHGTDVPTPSGGSRFIDKGPSEKDLLTGASGIVTQSAHAGVPASTTAALQLVASHTPTLATVGAGGMFFSMSGESMTPLAGAMNPGGGLPQTTETDGAAPSAYSASSSSLMNICSAASMTASHFRPEPSAVSSPKSKELLP